MEKMFIRSGPVWTFICHDQPDGEHCFAEFGIREKGTLVFVQADYFENEFTFSASSESARPFFEETAGTTAILPPLLEVFNEVPNSRQSQYAGFYAELKALLDKMILPQHPMTTADGTKMLKQFFENRQRNGIFGRF